MFQLADELG